MLVAALAADDLAGTDRDQALELTGSCTECALLYTDLLALANATAAAPPPIAFGRRDFRLSPADAARLRPAGWRRLAAAWSGARSGLSRPLGVGLATIGLAGLLIGNVQVQFGSSAASAPQGGAGSTREMAAPAAPSGDMSSITDTGSAQATPEGGPAAAAASAAASAAPMMSGDSAFGPVGSPRQLDGNGGALVPAPTDKSTDVERITGDALLSATDPETNGPFRPLNLLFGAAIVLGLALLLVSLRKGRATR
jgi:hypothetical protein